MADADSGPNADTVLLDVDGTLIDSNYWHVAAWQQAFEDYGHWQAAWRIHSFVGMGGDKLVAAVAGDEVERKSGDQLRSAWKEHYDGMISSVRPFPGASELVRELKRRHLTVVLASSGNPEHLEVARKLLDVDDAIDAITTAEDVEASKPSGDLFQLGLDKAGGRSAIVIGDTPWDIEAAGQVPAPVIALRCGGFSERSLLDGGAWKVFDDPADLLAQLGRALS